MKLSNAVFGAAALSLLALTPAQAVTVNYLGANGASATADYSLDASGTSLSILLTNTSTAPFNGGSAAAVLSSINFALPLGVSISGGSVALGQGSRIVYASGGAWQTADPSPVNLNAEYAYTNTGMGNTGAGTIAGAVNGVTSHSNGTNNLTQFTGTAGPGVTGGLQPGILANGTPTFGSDNAYWVMNSVLLTLNLSGPLVNGLAFLEAGSYVEFGSDAQFVSVCGPNQNCTPVPPCTENCDPGDVPEPTTLALVGLGLLGGIGSRRRR